MVGKMRFSLVLIGAFLFGILLLSFVSAEFSLGNKSRSIETVYGESENVRGWINISFQNEPVDSLVKDNTDRSIKIIDLLKKRGSYVYSCSPVDCSKSYNAENPGTLKVFDVGVGDSKVVGLKFNGILNQVSSINFQISSDAAVGCENQISVDIFDDKVADIINTKSSSSASCTTLKSYGCWDQSKATEEYDLSTTPYCQKINLSQSPGFNIGAWVRKGTGGVNVEPSIYDVQSGMKVAKCFANTDNGEEFSCSVDYPIVQAKEYYVCMATTGAVTGWKVRGNTNPTNGCGFRGLPPPSAGTPGAYQIFAEGKGFDAVGTIEIKNSVNGKNLSSLVYEYILNKYGTNDCTNGCVVPIRISGVSQRVTFSGLSSSYQKTTGAVTENNFYDLAEIPGKVSSDFQNIYLDEAQFTVPNKKGLYKFTLNLGDKQILSENLNVSDVPKIISLYPLSTASAYPTDFILSLNSSTVVGYFWDFGDNQTEITTTKSVTHTYSQIGNYTLKVTATDTKGLKSTKEFNIEVQSPKALISALLDQTRNGINNVKNQGAQFDEFSKTSIDAILQIVNKEQNLTSIESRFNSAQSETEYNIIVGEILALGEMPQSISEGFYANSLNFFPDREIVNLETIKSITNGKEEVTGKENDYLDAITLWNNEYLDSKITFTDYLGDYEGNTRSVVKVFTLDVKPKKEIVGDYFLIIPEIQNLMFDSSVTPSKKEGYVFVNLKGKEQVSFSTTETVDFSNIPAFISPALGRLSMEELNILEEEEPRWTILVLVLIFLGIVALIVYIILQEWYKRRYENYLFKNKNDLLNMATYIHNSKKKGMENKEIESNLKRAKWSSEQIRYTMKKYAGERTGMFEIPITNAANLLKKKDKDDKNKEKKVSDNHKKL